MVKSTHQMQPKYVLPKHRKLIFTAGTFLITGIVFLTAWPWLMRTIIEQGHTLKPDSITYNLWKKNIIPLPLDFYLFNWTNPHEIYNKSCKPKFVEVGPIRFIETKEKVNITWNSNDTVSFRQRKVWQFDRASSAVDLDTNITTINAVTLAAAYKLKYANFWLKKGLQMTLSQLAPKLHVTKKIGQILFDGYEDIFVQIGNAMHFTGNMPKMDRFGWFYSRNGSSETEGYFNMDTTLENIGKLRNWNTLPYSPFYPDECNKIEGSAGEFFHPNSLKDKISIFTPDLCRSMHLDLLGEDVVSGVKGLKYVAADSTFDNGTKIPENKCFCLDECAPSGALNVSTCKFGTPGFVSLPHFYNGDEYYTRSIEGLKPEKSKHEFYMTLEPTTGIPLSVSAKLQLNLLLQPVQYITIFENVPRVFFPVLWFEQSVDIPSDFVTILKLLLNLPLTLQIVGFLFVFVGVTLTTLLMYQPVVQMIQPKKTHFENHIIIRELEPFKTCKDESGIDRRKEEQPMLA